MRHLPFAVLFLFAAGACRGRDERPAPPPAPDSPSDAGIPAPTAAPPDAKPPAPTPAEPAEPEEPSEAAPPRKIAKGERAVVRIGSPVVVVNPTPVDDGVWRFPYGSACFTEPDGRTEVVAIETVTEEGETWDDLLIRYRRPPKPERVAPAAEPTMVEPDLEDHDPSADDHVNAMPDHACPTGTLYFMEASEHAGATEPEEDDQPARVERLLKPERAKTRKKK